MSKKTNRYTLSDVLGAPATKEEIMSILMENPKTWTRFNHFSPVYQNEIIQFMMGNRGVKILYNSFFLNVFNPQIYPERLESLLSALLGEKIKIKASLPREGIQLTEKGSFVIMDILVELEDGTLFNLEIQKIGYEFPGQRSNCYISDLIMRQYNRLRSLSDQEHPFDYREMKPVQLLVLMEKSSSGFKKVAPQYIHTKQITYSSGANVFDLEKVTYISLDTFRGVVQNNIDNRLHAWLTFLCNDDPDAIIRLITAYPEFIPIYQDIAKFRSDPKEVVYMFSDALRELDHNTEVYMVEEERKKVLALTKQLDEATQKCDAATKERDVAAKERDVAAKERDVAAKERDAAQSEIARLQSLLLQHNIDPNS